MARGSLSDWKEALAEGDATMADSPQESDTDRSESPRAQAFGRHGLARRGEMNKTEARYARILSACDEVIYWKYEEIGFRYGSENDSHWPDFVTVGVDGQMTVHEVKGRLKQAGRLRFVSCAQQHPEFRWLMVMQTSPKQPWQVKYDTADEDGRPFLNAD